MKKERPILFSSAMVQALLAGRKTQTRRIIKPQPIKDEIIRGERMLKPAGWPWLYEREFKSRFCHYGQPGDILWVREEHYVYGQWIKNGKTKAGKQKWKFERVGDDRILFEPFWPCDNNMPGKVPIRVEKNSYRKEGWYKRLARFMPRKYCRIYLEITDIRVERVQDISEEDAKAEGVQKNCIGPVSSCVACSLKGDVCLSEGEYFHYLRDFEDFPAFSAIESFESLWQKINGPESWQANPWVWAVSLTLLSTTGKPDNK